MSKKNQSSSTPQLGEKIQNQEQLQQVFNSIPDLDSNGDQEKATKSEDTGDDGNPNPSSDTSDVHSNETNHEDNKPDDQQDQSSSTPQLGEKIQNQEQLQQVFNSIPDLDSNGDQEKATKSEDTGDDGNPNPSSDTSDVHSNETNHEDNKPDDQQDQSSSTPQLGEKNQNQEQQHVVSEDGKYFGNKDQDKEYPLDYNPEGSIVVRFADMETSGGVVSEVKHSAKIQIFDPSIFEHLKNTDAFKGKSVLVIHD